MDKNNLIKDTLIFANIISLMTKATNRCISKNSGILSGVECEIDPGALFHASTLSDMLSLPMDDVQTEGETEKPTETSEEQETQETVEKEPVTEEQNTEEEEDDVE